MKLFLAITIIINLSTIIGCSKYYCFPFFDRQRPDGNIITSIRGIVDAPSRMSRHHIIPYSTISTFFREILKPASTQLRFESAIINIVNRLLSMTPWNSENNWDIIRREDLAANNLIYRFIYTNENNRRRIIQSIIEDNLEHTIEEMIIAYITWFPANIFIGPTDRSDDPGNAIESNSIYIVGSDHYRNMYIISELMITYNTGIDANGNRLNLEELRQVRNNVLFQLSSLTNITTPFSYNSNQWKQNSLTGKWSIKKESYPPPLFLEKHTIKKKDDIIFCNTSQIFNFFHENVESVIFN